MLDIIGQCEGPKGQNRNSSVSLKMSLVGGKADFDFRQLEVRS